MATYNNTAFFLTTLILLSLILTEAMTKTDQFAKKLKPESISITPKHQKLSHLHFYFHDIVDGKKPTAMPIVKPKTNTFSSFGLVTMMDDPLTVRPEVTSKMVGRAQGIYASASQTELSFLMVLNFVFFEGKYNGSTLSVLGRNSVFSGVREMPVVGGSGLFRFATGYAQAKTYEIDLKTGDAVVEYNVFVFHY